MKLKQWLYGAAALAMLAGCSDKDVAPGSSDNNGNGSGEGGGGYLAVQINLPQQPSSRAITGEHGENDFYDDGESWEYDVDNALIILFTGKATETTVGDKTVYVPDEASKIKYLRAQELEKPFFWNEDPNDNITTSYLAAIQVKNKNFKDNLWAIVMLNRDNSKFIYDKTDDTVSVLTDDGTTKEITTYADLQAAITKSEDDSDFITSPKGNKRIFMTNAPLSNVMGGPTATETSLANPYIETLSYLGTADQLYDSMEEAKSNPAACIFVERAVAKVTYGGMANNAIQLSYIQRVPQVDAGGNPVVDSEGNPVYEDTDLPSTSVKAESSVQYCLSNKNKRSYIIRKVDFTDNHFSWDLSSGNGDMFRMIGSVGMPALKTPFHKEMKNLYRTYWCEDPNYGEMPEADKIEYFIKEETSEAGETKIVSSFVPTSQALYCKENTFNVKFQTHGNTTLAIFQVNFDITKKVADDQVGKSNGSLYIRDDNKEKVYLTPEEAMAPALIRVYNDNKVKEYLKSLAKTGVTGTYKVSDYVKVGFTVGKDKKVTWNDIKVEIPEGGDTFFPATVKDPTDNSENPKTIPTTEAFRKLIGSYTDAKSYAYSLLTDINNWFDVTEYTGGISYYVVPVKHFGDWSCPWDGTGTETTDTYNDENEFIDSDLAHAKNYLGRYGMVRNNWYELNIKEIKALGSAVPPEIEDDLSDDFKEDKKYFAIEIHTLSWAKRTQSVSF